MEATPETTLAAAMVAAWAEFPPIPKSGSAKVPTKSGGSFAYSYPELAEMLALVRPVLARHGLAVVLEPVTTEDGVGCLVKLHHVGGEVLSFGPLLLPLGDRTAQAFGSALTYAKRYALGAVLSLELGGDDDDAVAATSSAPAASRSPEATTRTSLPPDGDGGAQEKPKGRSSAGCQHVEWKPGRPGWRVCESCGHAWKVES